MELFSESFWVLCGISFVVGCILVLLWIIIAGLLKAFPRDSKPKKFAYTILFPLIVLVPLFNISIYAAKHYLDIEVLSLKQNISVQNDEISKSIEFTKEVNKIIDNIIIQNKLSEGDINQLKKADYASKQTARILDGQQKMQQRLIKEGSKNFYKGIIASLLVGCFVSTIIAPSLQSVFRNKNNIPN